MTDHFVSDHCVLCGGAIYAGDDWCADFGLSATSKGAERGRRLRDLERACRAMREFEPLTIVWQHNYDAIGRLLEGER